MTNYEKLMSEMTPEKMAEMLSDRECVDCILKEKGNCQRLTGKSCKQMLIEYFEQEEPKWHFTEQEKVILSAVDERLNWIVRNKAGRLTLFDIKPQKYPYHWDVDLDDGFWLCPYLNTNTPLFKCIKWEDEEPCEFRKFL